MALVWVRVPSRAASGRIPRRSLNLLSTDLSHNLSRQAQDPRPNLDSEPSDGPKSKTANVQSQPITLNTTHGLNVDPLGRLGSASPQCLGDAARSSRGRLTIRASVSAERLLMDIAYAILGAWL